MCFLNLNINKRHLKVASNRIGIDSEAEAEAEADKPDDDEGEGGRRLSCSSG